MPPGEVGGIYADFVQIWHSEDVFTLDFSALAGPPQVSDEGEGEPVVVMNAQVVARVRIPPSQIFEIMKALERQLSDWESCQDKIRRQTGTSAPPS
jgi:hypothetical protein